MTVFAAWVGMDSVSVVVPPEVYPALWTCFAVMVPPLRLMVGLGCVAVATLLETWLG